MASSPEPFQGKVALVTGGSRGIGRAIALELARAGADVAVNFRKNAEAAQEVVTAVRGYGRKTLAIQADVAKQEAVDELLGDVVDHFGGLDLLVCSAASGRYVTLADFPLKALDLALKVNVVGAFLCAQAAAAIMAPRGGGRIVMLASPGSRRVFPGYMAVGASKGALDSLVRYLAVELAPRNIVVNAVAPGICDTEALRAYMNQEAIDTYVARTPRGRQVTPEEVASLVAFLCREETSMICGQVISIDGGFFLPF